MAKRFLAWATRVPVRTGAGVLECKSVFNFLLNVQYIFFVDVAFFVDRSKLQRVAGDYFEVSSALIALDDVAFFNIFGIYIQRVVAFRTYDGHNRLLLSCSAI